jgi:hypothetical protein
VALLAVVGILFAGVELASRYAFPRIDRGMRRYVTEVKAAAETRQTGAAKQVIIAGNSLLDKGVLFEEASRSLQPQIDAVRVMVPDTNYYDWYYGLRRLLARGARPDVVVLSLSPRQLVASRIRGAYTARHLCQTGDVFRMARGQGLSNTETSNLIFANFSAYFGDGDEIRKDVVRRMIPDLPALMALMTRTDPAPPVPEDVYARAAERLRALSELTAAWDVRLVLLVPPSGEAKGDRAYDAVRRAGLAADVPVIMPVEPGSIPPELYSDGFHLNPGGAKLFTAHFVDALRKEIASDVARAHPHSGH